MKLSTLLLSGISTLPTLSIGAVFAPSAVAFTSANTDNVAADAGSPNFPTRARRDQGASQISKASAIVSATNVPIGRPLVREPHPSWLAMNNASSMFGWQLVAGSTQAHAAYLCGNLGAYSDMWTALGFNFRPIQEILCQAGTAKVPPNSSYIADQIRTSASNVYLTYVLNAGKVNSTTFWASACEGLLPQLLDAIDLDGNYIHSTICSLAGYLAGGPGSSPDQNVTIPNALSAIQNQASRMYAYLLVGTWKLPNDASDSCATVSPTSNSSASTRAHINATKMLNADIIAKIWCSYAEPGAGLPVIAQLENNVTNAKNSLFINQIISTVDPTTTYIQYLRDNMPVQSLDWEGLNGPQIMKVIDQTANGD